ncbi:MAG: DUF1361 domain-containing protein [Chitinophaga sp.]|jgi:uncharacterized membrane protein|nr:DUF1361 domain-containing protein [Chitinophaga sp.]
MKNKISSLEKMLLLSVAFSMLLLTVRIIITHELSYIFYAWNTFLAIVPLLFSRRLSKQLSFNFKAIVLIVCWLLFLPNAPYIVTDIFHYMKRPPVPMWYDLLIVMIATWNGLLLGFISLLQVEQFLTSYLKPFWVKASVIVSLILCGYGVYLGRFLRFNSWDILTNPDDLFFASARTIIHPHQSIKAWAFTFLFASMLSIIYFTIKQLPRLYERGK